MGSHRATREARPGQLTGARRTALLVLAPVVWAAGMFGARLHPWLSVGLAALVLIAAVLLLDAVPRQALRVPARKVVVLAVLATAAMVAVTELFSPRVLAAFPAIRVMSAHTYRSLLGPHGTLAGVAFVIPVVFAEELIWRGAFQNAIATRSKTATVLVSAAVYAAAHATFGSALLVGVAFVCGIYWSALRAVSGSLLPSLMSHLVWDLILVLVPLAGVL